MEPVGSPLSRARKRHPFFWCTVLAGAATLALYAATAVTTLRGQVRYVDRGWTLRREGGGYVVDAVDPGGPAAGQLAAGDRLVALDGLSMDDFPRWRYTLSPARPYHMDVKRDGSSLSLVLPVVAHTAEVGARTALMLAVGLSFLIATALAGLLRPEQPVPRLFTLTGFATAWFYPSLAWRTPGVLVSGPRLIFALSAFIWPIHLVFAYLLFSRLPPGVVRTPVWRWLGWILGTWAALLCLTSGASMVLGIAPDVVPRGVVHAAFALWSVLRADQINLAASAAVIAVIARNRRRAPSLDAERRMRWFLHAAIAGVLPMLVLTALDLVVPATSQFGGAFQAQIGSWMFASNVFVVIVPVAFAYALLRNRVLDVEVVWRRGLSYLLARRSLQVALLLPAALLVGALVRERDRPVGQVFAGHPVHLGLLAMAVVCLPLRRPLHDRLDRVFFRAAHDRDRRLLEVVDEVRRQESLADVSRLVGERVRDALHPRTVHVLYRDSASPRLRPAWTSSESQSAPVGLESGLARKLEAGGSVALSEARSDLGREESEALAALGVDLAVAIGGGERRLEGAILLGEKLSGEPYSPAERRLVESVAAAIELRLENVALRERLDRGERIQRDVLQRLEPSAGLLRECPACGRCGDAGVERCPADGVELTLTLPVERTIDDKYRLERRIGKGGMGAVYAGTDLRLGRRVAVKVMTGALFGDGVARGRFEREARSAARLRHPGVVAVHDYGVLDGGGAYLVLELVEGGTLRGRLDPKGSPPPQVAAWFEPILEAVGAAHAAGLVHRDLKPENVLVGRTASGGERIQVADFGLAKVLGGEGDETSLTASGTVLGTLSYMSPEQLRGEEVDARSDVFSLGVMMVEALTGKHPFREAASSATATAILTREVRLRRGRPEEVRVATVLEKALAKDREKRYPSGNEMALEVLSPLRACMS